MPEGDHHERPRPDSAGPPEALLVCPACAAPLAAGAYETHLRQAHRRFFFRGAHRPYDEALALLLNLLAGPTADAEAWRALSIIAREDHGPSADRFLASALGGLLAHLGGTRRAAVAEGLATLLAAERNAGLTAALAADRDEAPRRLALAVVGRLPPPLDRRLWRPLRGLLADRRLPVEARFAAASLALCSAGRYGPAAERFLRRLVAGLGKARAVERLRQFERRFGAAPAIDSLCAKLEERMRMSCPRCAVQLRRPRMICHLWDEHRLVLDGRKAREPWSVVEEWIDEYRASRDADLLERCRVRGQQLDPAEGLHRVHRLLLRAGAHDAEARRDLTGLARERHASLCPWCYALAPSPREAPTPDVNLRRGRLSAGEYVVETSSKEFVSAREVRAPGRVLFRGRDAWWAWTRRGATLFLVGPPALAALAVALAWDGGPAPVAAVAVLAVFGLVTLAFVRASWPAGGEAPERLVRDAWALLAPRLHENGFVAEDSAFLAGLASVTPAGAFRQQRAPLLAALLKRTEDAVAAGQGPAGHLAALRRLMVEDAAACGADPVPLVVDQISHCFDGRLPLAYAERLLAGWSSEWWTPGNLVRLRVLLCDRAFEAGFEVRNLLDAGRTAPALGDLLRIADPTGLAALRLLWSERPTRPWDHCGQAQTVFELAADPAHADLLGRHPDLLLWQREPAWVLAVDGGEEPMREAEILLCAAGVWLQEVRFTAPPAVVGETRKALGFELALGKHRFRGPGEPDALTRRVERWFRFAFNDFLPKMVGVHTWQSPERAAILRAWGAAPCPECGRHFLARVGAVGVALDETAG